MTDTFSIVYVPDVTQMPVGVPTPVNATQLFFGTGAPAPAFGADGGYYLDVAAFALYGPRAGGVWPGVALFRAPTSTPTAHDVGAYTKAEVDSAMAAASAAAFVKALTYG